MHTSFENLRSLIDTAGEPVTLESLPALQEEFILAINRIIERDAKRVFVEMRIVGQDAAEGEADLFSQPVQDSARIAQRVILVGDIHCDFTALKTMLMKLAEAEDYDYVSNAAFIFLGDYIDRGASPFQTLRLLLKLKEHLGERCILLRGNHDNFYYSDEEKRYMAPVSPSDTIDFFTEYLDEGTVEAFKNLWDILPWFVLLSAKEKKYLITHGSIPRDDLATVFSLDEFKKLTLPLAADGKEKVQLRRCLNSMTWGDPVEAEMKYNSGQTRFEFGSKQFDAFMNAHGFTHLVRGHEPVSDGCDTMYGGRLTTLFSSGGAGNEDSYYQDLVPNPAFAIIDEEGELHGERIFGEWAWPEKEEAFDGLDIHEP